jgi:hypothetical protein
LARISFMVIRAPPSSVVPRALGSGWEGTMAAVIRRLQEDGQRGQQPGPARRQNCYPDWLAQTNA